MKEQTGRMTHRLPVKLLVFLLTCGMFLSMNAEAFAAAVSDSEAPEQTTVSQSDAPSQTVTGRKQASAPQKSTTASASGQCGDNLTWVFDESTGTLTISGSGDMWDFDNYSGLAIPWGSCQIKSVNFDENITSIGKNAFLQRSELTSVTIPDSVTTIGERAFAFCTALNNVTIGNSVNSIKRAAFASCTALMNISIPDSVTVIDERMFAYCTNLVSVTIGNSVSSIPYEAFLDCTSLKIVKIGNSVKRIDSYAFKGCKNLARVTIPDSVTYIGGAFEGCTSLKTVIMPDSVTSIGSGAFSGCSSLTSLTISDSVNSIGSYAFSGCSSLTSLTIPDSVNSIGNYTFSNCSKLVNLILPDTVTSIGSYAFNNCKSLTSVTIDYSITLIDEGVFYGCSSLTSLTIPDTITSIGSYAFSGCSSLMSLTIPDTVTSIGSYAFSGCSSLTSLIIPDTVTSIGSGAFAGCSGITSIPPSITRINESMFSSCSSLISVIIPDSITYIDKRAFEGCKSLTSVTIPDSVTFMGHSVFSGCKGLKSVVIGNSVSSIESYSFYDCTGLAEIFIPESVVKISSNAFLGCENVTDIYYAGSEQDWYDLFGSPEELGMNDNDNIVVHFNALSIPFLIMDHPVSATVESGSSGQVSVRAKGEGLSYQWYYMKSDDTDWNVWSGQTAATASAILDFTCNGMQVYCKVTDKYGNSIDSDVAVFTVIQYLTASPESEQTIGEPVVLTATGGNSYRFYYEQNGKWVNIRNFSTENACLWIPTAPRDYTIYVDIKDESGKVVTSKRIEYIVTDAYPFTLDKEGDQNVGVNMTLTAKGGSSYKFYYEYNGAWCNISSNTTGICEWSPKYAGSYMLYVDIKDETGKVIACRTQAFKLNDPFSLTSDVQSTELPYGKTINFTADGGTSYKFYYEKQGEWQRVQDFSSKNTCAWIPTAAGTYNFYCDIKDASGAVVSCKRMTFNITNPYSFTADKATTQSVGTKITFTATGGYQYKFYYEKDGSWVRIQSFSTSDTCAWTPTVAGRYNVYCDIADENGTVLAYKGMEFVIGDAGTTDYTFTTNVESPQPMNTAVILSATGGASYKFYYEVGGKWATIQNFSTANSATWTPDMIADYTLYVDIKNASGKVVKTLSKNFSVTDPYSFTADVTSPQNIGKSVKFTATGGASYKFYYQYAGAWVKIQDSSSATCNWKPNKAGEYMVYVDIKNASGTVLTCRTMKLVFNDPYRFTTSASSLTQPAGTAISLSANGGMSYKFYYEKDGAWVRIQDYATTKTCTWTPTEAGKYNVFCDIKDASGSVAVCKRITFTITEKCTITASKTNASVGDTITLTATGGSSYKFYYEKDGAWVRIQSFSTSNTCNWKPTAAGDYVVYVDVNDANGNLIGCKGVRCVVG